MTWEEDRPEVTGRISTLEKDIAVLGNGAEGMGDRLVYIQKRVDDIDDKIDTLTIKQAERPSWLMAGVMSAVSGIMCALLACVLM